jgi:FIMAH domain-containing protein
MARTTIALLAICLALMGSVAHAETLAECQAQLAALREQTLSTTFTGKNAATDQANLVAKLDAASAKLAEGKFTDAVQKLQDFEAKVQQFIDAGKVAPDAGAALISSAEAVITCVNNLSAGT